MKTFSKFLLYVALIGCAAAFVLPLVWMVTTALKPIEQTTVTPPIWLPRRYYVETSEGARREVALGAYVSQASKWIVTEGGAAPHVVPSGTVDGNQWRLTETRAIPVTVLRDVPATLEAPWREVRYADNGKADVVPVEQLQGSISFRWENFPGAIAAMQHFWRYLGNTVLLCVLNVVGTVASSSLAAYGFSRIEWRGREFVFGILLGTMMIPFPVVMVPLYGLFRALGWIGTMRPLWVGAFCAGAFNVFLLRQFFRTLPRELSEAARLDGCGEFRIFWQIILPLCRPALIVVGLFTFLGTWNDFLGPLIYLTDQRDFTLALALQSMQTKSGLTDWHYLMAASTLVILPILALFFVAQRRFVEGIALTGGKS